MKPFTDTLREINNGAFSEELTESLRELVAACMHTGKAGSITVSLKLKPAKGGGGVMTLDHDYKIKSPEFDRPTEFMFVTKQNALVREHPNQKKLDLREVAREATNVLEVGDQRIDINTGEVLAS